MSSNKADQSSKPASRPRVLVLGGGFAGIGAARKLRKADVDVVMIDGHDYHTFQPLLYQVATDLLPQGTVGHPLRDLFDDQTNARVHTTEVTSVDLDKREVGFAEMDPLEYDYLVLALGAEVNFFGVKGAVEHAFPLYTLADAVRLREHILEQWEAADKNPGLIEDGALNVVVVGGGPTGVESAGAIAELYRAIFVKDYPDIDQDKAQIVLVEAGPEIFTMFKPGLRTYAQKALGGRDVEVLCGQIVESVTATRVTLKSGRVIPAHTLVWARGCKRTPSSDHSVWNCRRRIASRSSLTSASRTTRRRGPQAEPRLRARHQPEELRPARGPDRQRDGRGGRADRPGRAVHRADRARRCPGGLPDHAGRGVRPHLAGAGDRLGGGGHRLGQRAAAAAGPVRLH